MCAMRLHGLLRLGLLATLLACRAPGVRAETDRGADEPRLVVGGDLRIEPGRRIDLQWSATDDVRELEILLSTDGGATFTTCISPQLDPDRHHFEWRVPARLSGRLCLRIRFNRGGREIEGAPIRLDRSAGDEALPLGLPAPEAPSRSPGRGESSLIATSDDEGFEQAPAITVTPSVRPPRDTPPRILTRRDPTPPTFEPRYLPLRI